MSELLTAFLAGRTEVSTDGSKAISSRAKEFSGQHNWHVDLIEGPDESIPFIVASWPNTKRPANAKFDYEEGVVEKRGELLRRVLDLSVDSYDLRPVRSLAEITTIRDFLKLPKILDRKKEGAIYVLTQAHEMKDSRGNGVFQLWEVKPRPGQSAYEQTVSQTA